MAVIVGVWSALTLVATAQSPRGDLPAVETPAPLRARIRTSWDPRRPTRGRPREHRRQARDA